MISDETIYKTVDYQKVYSNANELLVSNHVIEMFPLRLINYYKINLI